LQVVLLNWRINAYVVLRNIISSKTANYQFVEKIYLKEKKYPILPIGKILHSLLCKKLVTNHNHENEEVYQEQALPAGEKSSGNAELLPRRSRLLR
jgi:hypothetical protein